MITHLRCFGEGLKTSWVCLCDSLTSNWCSLIFYKTSQVIRYQIKLRNQTQSLFLKEKDDDISLKSYVGCWLTFVNGIFSSPILIFNNIYNNFMIKYDLKKATRAASAHPIAKPLISSSRY